MAIPQARIDTAAHSYIASGYNQAAAYRAAHPGAADNTALCNAPAFMNKYDVKSRAREILEQHKLLNLKSIVTGFTEPLQATNGVYFKGFCIAEEPAHGIRLEARKFIAEKLHGLGGPDTVIDNRSVNVEIQATDTGKLDSLISKLESLAIVSQDHSSRRAIAIEE